ncbi:hypothetical protein DOK67_0002861 [Enterococcus sp. DIV0212c]|uniref:hypothetical protein n=1 Tax=Enterococcus sp. DIV0212c TaxID=2230867 RepID=UPI001A9BB39C|nr:hypothetical protein [Enterococcus sp. DIV0212c]MBO1354411.1 hypothetical protein [Enterococcus sp. DIV0212c]
MKKLIGITALLLLLSGCSGTTKEAETSKKTATETSSVEKEPKKAQKDKLVKLVTSELNSKKVAFEKKDNKWDIQLKKEKNYKKWIVSKNDSKAKGIKAIFKWDGKEKSTPEIMSLLVNGEDLNKKETTKASSAEIVTDSTTSEVKQKTTNITPAQFLGQWYEIDGLNRMNFTKTTSGAIETSEVIQEGNTTKFVHEVQRQSDFTAWITQDPEHGDVLELIFVGSDSVRRFSRTPKEIKDITKENTSQSKQEETYLDPNILTEKDISEVEQFYITEKEKIVQRKRNQANMWKNNGDVDWDDTFIESGLTDFESKLPSFESYRHLIDPGNLEEIKSKIFDDFSSIFNRVMVK